MFNANKCGVDLENYISFSLEQKNLVFWIYIFSLLEEQNSKWNETLEQEHEFDKMDNILDHFQNVISCFKWKKHSIRSHYGRWHFSRNLSIIETITFKSFIVVENKLFTKSSEIIEIPRRIFKIE